MSTKRCGQKYVCTLYVEYSTLYSETFFYSKENCRRESSLDYFFLNHAKMSEREASTMLVCDSPAKIL
jgi:hypothetical protein